ncbi:EAL domain-containing protein [Aliiglaciecola sp. CAU 1673]|uniref:EAL domain-containing protein n=1 Tax=Aliiglaciecola sp. CAU 1673 TaxID=3032595 RepID=UPI0023DA9AF3|nr:EAL domain-containing protein [Aliiglaciecola sp. CAU 1673]MDF2177075.1 EAL domain-containing protein [Aliiglaciecola sp. CAU 1673]
MSAVPTFSIPNNYQEPKVAELASRNLVTCPPDMPLQQVAALMRSHHVSCILIKQGHDILGIWSEGDAKKIDYRDTHSFERPIKDFMTPSVIHIDQDMGLNDAAGLMLQKRIRRLLVVDKQKRPLGILTQTDILRQQRIEFYLKLRDVGSSINKRPLFLSATLPLADGVRAMQVHQVDAAIIEFTGKPPGIITERDLVTVIAKEQGEVNLGDVAVHPLVTVHKDCSLLQAVDLLKEIKFRHLAVCDDQERLIGLLSFSDILSNVEHLYVEQLKQALEARDAALRTSTDYLRLAQKVIDASLHGIMITDVHGVIESVNPSFTLLTGYAPEEAIGRRTDLLKSGLHDKSFYQSLWQTLLSQGHWQGEIWNKRKDGQIYPQWLSITAIRGENGEISQFAGIFSDISERKQHEKQIHQLAYIDELTGLANRRMFMDRLQLAIANAHRHHHKMAVMFLDLDLFKRINDTLGHQAGDQALSEVARRLKQTVREGESVARIGGDEFTILIPEIEQVEQLDTLARRLVAQFEDPIRLKDQDFFLTTSIGISLYPKDGQCAEQLIKHADLAMYEAKGGGRNQYCFYQSHTGQQTADELKMEQGLRLALQQRRLQVHYQPKVSLCDNALVGLEALVRWHDSELGQVSPAEFIPLAEKLGLIGILGDQVLSQVCKDMQQGKLSDVPVSVNVSSVQLTAPDFCQRLCATLDHYAIPPERIELEITESCLIPEEADSTLRLLTKLRNIGLRLSIDDFGTGYSSLAYLRRLPLDTLKIDRCFIKELPDNGEDGQIAQAILAMAKALNLQVVAEGVENEAQCQFLRQAGCTIGQGYLYAKPLSIEALSQWLKDKTTCQGCY